MPERRATQTITSSSNQQKSVPVVIVESFYNSHAEKLHMKLEGLRVGFHLAPELLAVAAEAKIAVFRTPMITMKFINAATIALEMDFSPTVTEFGSMVDILGIGVLIRGASGIGKSECVLGLIERGYSLVADDVTRITSLE